MRRAANVVRSMVASVCAPMPIPAPPATNSVSSMAPGVSEAKPMPKVTNPIRPGTHAGGGQAGGGSGGGKSSAEVDPTQAVPPRSIAIEFGDDPDGHRSTPTRVNRSDAGSKL